MDKNLKRSSCIVSLEYVIISINFLFGKNLCHNLDKVSKHVYSCNLKYIKYNIKIKFTLTVTLTIIFEKPTKRHFVLINLVAEMAIVAFDTLIVDKMLTCSDFGYVM